MIRERFLSNIDWTLIVLLLLNSILGVFIIYSASHYLPGNYYLKQIFWIIISVGALFLFLTVDYKNLIAFSLHFYIISIFILAGLLLFGRIIAGTRSWIRLPFIQAQPSELTKIIVILLLARLFSKFKGDYFTWREAFFTGAIIFFPIILVSLQPDLGTALTYIPLGLGALILAGIDKRKFIVILILLLVFSAILWNFYLKDYQKDRLFTLISPSKDPLGSGYHIIQSRIAVGSGGILGQGYKKGTQSQLRFLPARHTDFIFSVMGEDFGFVGVLVVLLFYFLLLLRLFRSVEKSRDRAGVYVVFLVSMMIAFQFFVNLMMVIGLFPITGIPFPLLSYGGSSLLTNYLGISLVLNVNMRRFVNV